MNLPQAPDPVSQSPSLRRTRRSLLAAAAAAAIAVAVEAIARPSRWPPRMWFWARSTRPRWRLRSEPPRRSIARRPSSGWRPTPDRGASPRYPGFGTRSTATGVRGCAWASLQRRLRVISRRAPASAGEATKPACRSGVQGVGLDLRPRGAGQRPRRPAIRPVSTAWPTRRQDRLCSAGRQPPRATRLACTVCASHRAARGCSGGPRRAPEAARVCSGVATRLRARAFSASQAQPLDRRSAPAGSPRPRTATVTTAS